MENIQCHFSFQRQEILSNNFLFFLLYFLTLRMETPPNISQGNVEYKSSQDRIREFVGKVKIILVESPKGIYLLKRWTAAFIALSQMFIGINNVMILFYALSFKSNILTTLHIFLCMVGVSNYIS